MNKKIYVSHLFPNYHLSKEEAEMVRHFVRLTGVNVSGGEDVNSYISFIRCIEANTIQFESAMNEVVSSLERNKTELPLYRAYIDHKYKKASL